MATNYEPDKNREQRLNSVAKYKIALTGCLAFASPVPGVSYDQSEPDRRLYAYRNEYSSTAAVPHISYHHVQVEGQVYPSRVPFDESAVSQQSAQSPGVEHRAHHRSCPEFRVPRCRGVLRRCTYTYTRYTCTVYIRVYTSYIGTYYS